MPRQLQWINAASSRGIGVNFSSCGSVPTRADADRNLVAPYPHHRWVSHRSAGVGQKCRGVSVAIRATEASRSESPDLALPKLRWNGTLRPDLRPDRKFFLKCCFESTAVPSAPATRSRRLWHARTSRVVAKFRQRKNSDFIGVFIASKFCARKFLGRPDRRMHFPATARRDTRRRIPGPNSPTPILKWSRCFFRCAVVIGVQCGRFATALSYIATHSILGGQHGEES